MRLVCSLIVFLFRFYRKEFLNSVISNSFLVWYFEAFLKILLRNIWLVTLENYFYTKIKFLRNQKIIILFRNLNKNC